MTEYPSGPSNDEAPRMDGTIVPSHNLPEMAAPGAEDVTASADAPAERDVPPDAPRETTSGKKPSARKRAAKGGGKMTPEGSSGAMMPGDDVSSLEAQGFTKDEVVRLIHISEQAANSREAREAEAVMRRLRFHRWLVERGLLDEFTT